MKKIAIALIAGLMLTSAMPAMAQMTKEEKDQCLLASKNCANEVDSLQQRIKKLNKEIKKGTKVYSADELKKLEMKLKEADEILKSLEKPGGK
jgi:DNA-binding transcriptional regulator GbsR (MarR family)